MTATIGAVINRRDDTRLPNAMHVTISLQFIKRKLQNSRDNYENSPDVYRDFFAGFSPDYVAFSKSTRALHALCTDSQISQMRDSVKPRETPGAARSLSTLFREERGGKTAETSAPALTFFMYHRELSTLMVQSLFTDGKNIWHGQIEAARGSTDFLRREFREGGEGGPLGLASSFTVTRSG